MASKQTQKTQQQQLQPQAQVSKQKASEAEAEKIKEYIAKQVLLLSGLQLLKTLYSIHYSDRYSDDEYEYRHVILPKPLFKMIPKSYFNPDDPGVLRLLSEAEWRGIGITQSLGWEHYEVHGTLAAYPSFGHLSDSATTPSAAPEPHVLLFRRLKNADALQAAQQVHEMHPQIKAAGAAKNGRKK